ncbi:MAG: serine/threonine-protein kinase [Blastocatellia bacterium]|nr:serine/threonine-protein kinase [Blastocatellia bacterium]
MTPERYQRISQIFQDALEYGPAQRDGFVAEACQGDPSLLDEVKVLLQLHQEEDTFFDEGGVEAGFQVLAGQEPVAPAEDVSGKEIGAYRLVREIGRGGMGVVYEAARADAAFHKRVALKVLKRGMDTDAVVARFRAERQILAGLEHPHIGRLLDGGTTAEGLPFFVLEYIDGQPITKYCDEHKLSITDRLKLFQQVCSAVQFAHRNLIVHRDIKPGNILVTSEGVPKLLDFGIAKVVRGENPLSNLDMTAADLTVTGHTPMTPAYASPEQVRGATVTTASDVYSLGILLYELLTGQRPYDVSGPFEQAARLIQTHEPPKPSAIVTRKNTAPVEESAATTTTAEQASAVREGTPARLRKRLQGDLDTIVLTALQKEPERRYGSVEALAEDLRRHLEGMPVKAQPDSFRYRAEKFVRRNRLGVAAGLLLTLSLVGGIIATTWQARVARAERARAEAERAVAVARFNDVRELANSFLMEFDQDLAKLPGTTPVREKIVKKSLLYLDRLTSQVQDDPTLQMEFAIAYQKVGDIQGRPYSANLGDTPGAIKSYRKSLEILQGLTTAKPGDLKLKAELCTAQERLSDVLVRSGDLDEALALLHKSKIVREEMVQLESGNAQYSLRLAYCLMKLGDIALDQTDDPIQALKLFQDSIAISERVVASQSNEQSKRMLAIGHYRVGHLFESLATRLEEQSENRLSVIDLFQQAVESDQKTLHITEELASLVPSQSIKQLDVASASAQVGLFLAKSGSFQEAESLMERSLRICEELSASDPQNAEIRGQLAMTYLWTGDMLFREGNIGQAQTFYLKAIALREGLANSDANNAEFKQNLAEMYYRLGVCRKSQKQIVKGIEALTKAADLLEDLCVKRPKNATLFRMRVQNLYELSHLMGINSNQARRYTERLFSELKARVDLPGSKSWECEAFAYLLATCPYGLIRNPGQACFYAQKAVAISDHKSPTSLFVLALTSARNGDSASFHKSTEKFFQLLTQIVPSWHLSKSDEMESFIKH